MRAATVATVVRDWLDHLPARIKDPTSVQIVRSHCERITRELGGFPSVSWRPGMSSELLGTMAADGLSTSTIRGCRSVLVRALDRAIRDRLVTVNVARVAEVPEGTRRVSRSMTTAQARPLLASDLTVWWRAYFRDDAGRPVSRQRMNVRFKDVLEAAGLGRDWQPRETRHSFVSVASDSGASIEDIADAAGHVNPNVTRAVYRHQISDTVTRAPAVMDRALAAGGGQA